MKKVVYYLIGHDSVNRKPLYGKCKMPKNILNKLSLTEGQIISQEYAQHLYMNEPNIELDETTAGGKKIFGFSIGPRNPEESTE